MTAYKADGEVAVWGEVRLSLALEHALHDGRNAGTHLSVVQFLRQLLHPSQLGKGLQHSQAVGNGTSHHGEGAFGRDESLEDDGILLHALNHLLQSVGGTIAVVAVGANEVGIVALPCTDHLQAFGVHGLDDVCIIVVEGKRGAITVEAVADIPFLGLRHSHLDAEGIVSAIDIHKERLFHTYEQEPVGIGRVVAAQALQFLDVALLGDVVKWFPQRLVAAEEALHDVGRIHQRLSAALPSQIVGALGVNGIGVGLQGPLAQLAAHLAFLCVVVGQRQPGSNAGHKSAEAFHVGHLLVAIVPSG